MNTLPSSYLVKTSLGGLLSSTVECPVYGTTNIDKPHLSSSSQRRVRLLHAFVLRRSLPKPSGRGEHPQGRNCLPLCELPLLPVVSILRKLLTVCIVLGEFTNISELPLTSLGLVMWFRSVAITCLVSVMKFCSCDFSRNLWKCFFKLPLLITILSR